MTRFLAPTPANNVWKLYVIRFLFWTHFVSSVLIPFFREWGGIDFTRILLLNAWFMLWNFLLEVPTGTVADFWGRRASLASGCAVAILGVLVYTSRPDFTIFLIGEVLIAAAMTLMSGADEALLYDSLKEIHRGDESALDAHAGVAIPRLESFKLSGIVLGAALGGFLAERFSLTMPMKAWMLPLALAFLLILTLSEPRLEEEESGAAHSAAAAARRYAALLFEGVRYFLAHRILRLLALDMVVAGALAWMIIWFYQPYLERAGMALRFFGFVHVGMSLGQIAILSRVDAVARFFGSERRLLRAGPIAAGLGFAVLGLVALWPAAARLPVVIVAILLAASFGLSRPALFGPYFNRHIPSAKRATVLSTVSMARTLTIALVYPLIGVLADVSLDAAVITIGAVLVVLGLVSRVADEHLEARTSPVGGAP